MSKEAWVFISTGLFYIIFGAYFLFEILYQKIKIRKNVANEEWLPVVDEDGKVLGKATRTACHQNKELLHPVVHLHIINNNKKIFLQKRPMSKLIQPGKWDTAVGGHISVNETLEIALKREAFEETGIKNFSANLISKYKWVSDVESELIFMFATRNAKDITTNPVEVDEGKFWSLKEINDNLGKNIFTPNFEHEFRILADVMHFKIFK
ncbi:MAG: NUDIX domain-containing protein [Bacteroidia bacterium]|nr:NUDIX domain-containing protein [Bacteroidia bacterium]